MTEKYDKSLDMVWIFSNKHCRHYRLCDPAEGLSVEQARDIANQMLSLFESEAERLKAANSGAASVPRPSDDPGNPGHSSHVRRSQQSVPRRPEAGARA